MSSQCRGGVSARCRVIEVIADHELCGDGAAMAIGGKRRSALQMTLQRRVDDRHGARIPAWRACAVPEGRLDDLEV